MEIKHVVVGTAGHIDHGKSSLVEALTGTHPDRLEEEKRRGITIDLGFAFLNLDGLQIGLVDVPGHERFVRTMLAGATGIDLVLLVVAADESIKPQTREHFDICRVLSIPRGLVVITKSDLVEAHALDLLKLEIEEFVRGSFLEAAPVVPVSALTHAGLDDLVRELSLSARSVPSRDTRRHFRLPIDRSFAMKGFGTVVTGTLVSGCLNVDDHVELYPAGRSLRVRGLQSGGQSVESAFAGQRTAVNLSGIDHQEIKRGMVLAPPAIFRPTSLLDAHLALLASAKPLKARTRLRFHQGSFDTVAEVMLLESSELSPGASAFAQIRLGEKILLLPGDRFVLRRLSPPLTLGGGVVIDVRPLRHRPGSASIADYLTTIERGSRDDILEAMVEASPQGIAMEEIVARTGWLEAEIGDAARALVGRKRLRLISEQPIALASPQAVSACGSAIQVAVETYHRENPLLTGIPKPELRARVGNPRPELFETCLNDLLAARVLSASGDMIHRAGREIELTSEEASVKKLIEVEFEQAGLAVPSFMEVVAKLGLGPGKAQKILQILLREKLLVKISEDLILHQKAVAHLHGLLADYRRSRGNRLPVPAFKELTGITRKYAIPLLEYLDRQHVTRRVGNERVIL